MMSGEQTPGVVVTERADAGSVLARIMSPILAVVAQMLLLDAAVETFSSGSPIRWSIAGVAALSLGGVALLWRRRPAALAIIPLTGLAASIAWATIRLGTGADPALRMATLPLARIAALLGVASAAAAVMLIYCVPFVRRRWYLGAPVAALALYALVPLVRGVLAAAPLSQILGGAFDWQRLPFWLQGGYLAAEVVLPIGLIAGLAVTITRMVRRTAPAWAAGGVLVVLAAFLTLSVEMTRAGQPNFVRVIVDPLIARVSLAPPSATAVPSEAASPGVSSPATVGGQQPGNAAPAPPVAPVNIAQPGQPVANKAIEVRVTNVRTAPWIGDRTADPGRAFVIVDTAWKNLLQPQRVNRKAAEDRTQGAGGLGFGGGGAAQRRAEDEANTTIESVKFEVDPLTRHLWLLVDGQFAEAIDVDATDAMDGHLPTGMLEIAKFQEVRSGSLAFQAPANAQALSLLFLDANNGHMLLPIKGAPPRLSSSLGGSSRANESVDLAVTGASWVEAASEPGMRTLVVGIKGISRQNAMVDVPFGEYAFLQTDQGCIAQPEERSASVTRSLAPIGRFLPLAPSEGQLAFNVPAATRGATFTFRPAQASPIDLPILGNAAPQRPAARATLQDGSVLRVLLVGSGAAPAGLAQPPSGSEYLVVDYVVENLNAGQGLELQADPQFGLVDDAGQLHPPDAASAGLPCRLTGDAVVPAGSWRRFSLLYAVPIGQPLSLQYRGFETSGTLKVR
jgi:hypothetical protein